MRTQWSCWHPRCQTPQWNALCGSIWPGLLVPWSEFTAFTFFSMLLTSSKPKKPMSSPPFHNIPMNKEEAAWEYSVSTKQWKYLQSEKDGKQGGRILLYSACPRGPASQKWSSPQSRTSQRKWHGLFFMAWSTHYSKAIIMQFPTNNGHNIWPASSMKPTGNDSLLRFWRFIRHLCGAVDQTQGFVCQASVLPVNYTPEHANEAVRSFSRTKVALHSWTCWDLEAADLLPTWL